MRKKFAWIILVVLSVTTNAPVSWSAGSYDWTGAYVGANLGGSFGRLKARTVGSPTGSGTVYLLPLDFIQISDSGNKTSHPGTFISGAQAGFNYQARKLVLGLETDFDRMPLDHTTVSGQEYLTAPGTGFQIRRHIRTRWLSTLRPRIGFAMNRLLIYGTTGMAFSRLKFEEEFTDTFTPAYESASKTRGLLGWALGAGIEYGVTKNWTVKAEYLFINFPSVSVHDSPLVEPAGGRDEFNHSANLDLHTVRLGINFKF